MLARVVDEISQVLLPPHSTLMNFQRGVGGLTHDAADEQAAEIYSSAASALSSVPKAKSGPRLHEIANSNQLPAKIWAIKALFDVRGFNNELTKVRYLKAVAPLMLNPTTAGVSRAVKALARSMEGHLHSSSAVPSLALLLTSSLVEVRAAAASSLADLTTPRAMRVLAETALNDPEQEVRYHAVRGLAELAAPETVITMPVFQGQEQSILQYWRRWASIYLR